MMNIEKRKRWDLCYLTFPWKANEIVKDCLRRRYLCICTRFLERKRRELSVLQQTQPSFCVL